MNDETAQNYNTKTRHFIVIVQKEGEKRPNRPIVGQALELQKRDEELNLKLRA